MKRTIFKMSVSLIVMTLVMVGISTNAVLAKQKTIELKYAGLVPAGTTLSDPIDEWGRRVSERTNGQVNLKSYHAQALGKWPEFPKLSKSGLCDLIFVTPGSPGFELFGATALPGLFSSQRVAMDVIYELYRKGLLSSIFEKNGFKLILLQAGDPRMFWFPKKKTTSFSELKGMKLRAITPVQIDIVKALGGAPVMISTGDLFMGLQRGTVDGLIMTPVGTLALKLDEVLKYVQWEPLVYAVSAIVMNLESWNRLPPETQTIISDVNEEIRYWFLGQYKSSQEYEKLITEKGIEVITSILHEIDNNN